MKNSTSVLFATALCAAGFSTSAAITGLTLGSGAPPATLGPFAMTSFPPDARPLDLEETGVPSPLGGLVEFDLPLLHTRVGDGWGSWSHGFTGDVYFDLTGGALSIELSLPPDTLAFYLYAEPEPLQVFEIFAGASDGTLIGQGVDGDGGASFFGFFATEGDVLDKIVISSSVPFAIGEFGIGNSIAAVPEASTWTCAGMLAAAVAWRMWRRRG